MSHPQRSVTEVHNQKLSHLGEAIAAEYVQSVGMRILHRNWHTRFCEVDLIALDGDCLVFIEIKTRATDRFLDPSAAVDHKKRRRLWRAAEAYIAFERPSFEGCRFDVISVTAGRGPAMVRHTPSAFQDTLG